MMNSPSPKGQPNSVEHPLPISRSTTRSRPETVELLERSAEEISLRTGSSVSHPGESYSNFFPSAPIDQQSKRHSYETYESFESARHRASYEHEDGNESGFAARAYIPRANNEFNIYNHSLNTSDPYARLAAPPTGAGISREPSTTSGSTLRQAGSLFKDFDGSHYKTASFAPTEEYIPEVDAYEEALQRIEAESAPQPVQYAPIELDNPYADQTTDRNEPDAGRMDILPSKQENSRWVEPPPSEGMVYYPAPVPINLNRPQRLSKVPVSAVDAQRRAQIFGSIDPKVRRSAMWLPESDASSSRSAQHWRSKSEGQGPKQRQSTANLHKLPPQLRASVFFEQPSVPHQIRVKGGSAVETLECLLDASAKAPHNATVDETLRTAMKDLENRNKLESKTTDSSDIPQKSRRLPFLPLTNASSDKIHQLLQRATNKLGFEPVNGTDPDDDEEDEEDENASADSNSNDELIPLADRSSLGSQDSDPSAEEQEQAGDQAIADDQDKLDDNETNVWTEEQYLGAPTTLLAELQLRKQELKGRNRTAVTDFPNGMHSTLLELDAVAQIEKKRRQTQRTALAWEDPAIIAASKDEVQDENIPLGVLFPGKNGLANYAGGNDWDRPLGLLERRQLEDQEPLSKRRNRLKGVKPELVSRRPPLADERNQADTGSDQEDETLAQRTRRLKAAKVLNEAIEDAAGEKGSSDFARAMSELGLANEHSGNVEHSDVTGRQKSDNRVEEEDVGEEETLGQRRQRLIAKGQSRDVSSEGQPELITTNSLANILAQNPMGNMRNISGESASSGLLGQNANTQAQRRSMISRQNQLSSYNMLNSPLINPYSNMDPRRQTSSGLLGASQLRVESRRQQIYDTNHLSGTVGVAAPLVEQPELREQTITNGGLLAQSQNERMTTTRQISQHNSVEGLSRVGKTRQSPGLMSGTYNDGTGGAALHATLRSSSGFPHQQSQANVLSQGFGNSGFGISPRHMSSSQLAAPLSFQSLAGVPPTQAEQPAQVSQMPSTTSANQDPETLSSKRWENIDRWRQSVMP